MSFEDTRVEAFRLILHGFNTNCLAYRYQFLSRADNHIDTAMRLGVSRAAVRKWCSERITLRHVVALCIALDVRADIGEELVSIAGLLFRRNDEDEMLHALLFETKDVDVARANEIMKQAGLPRLTYGVGENE